MGDVKYTVDPTKINMSKGSLEGLKKGHVVIGVDLAKGEDAMVEVRYVDGVFLCEPVVYPRWTMRPIPCDDFQTAKKMAKALGMRPNEWGFVYVVEGLMKAKSRRIFYKPRKVLIDIMKKQGYAV